ncbi:hypothetical protein CHARACLAT_030542 [Characodon lateralis]|uniref:Uncharacterized protein n=1 Tax=Characodon lateralis TaxID=208331 RepID=A0ABU7EE70_9TELE|nr:hypothetical protein [Characodon lateralis]
MVRGIQTVRTWSQRNKNPGWGSELQRSLCLPRLSLARLGSPLLLRHGHPPPKLDRTTLHPSRGGRRVHTPPPKPIKRRLISPERAPGTARARTDGIVARS